METRLSNILKTTKATIFIKTILESTYKVVLGTYNLEAKLYIPNLSEVRYIFFTFSFIFFSAKKFFFSKKHLHYKTFFSI